MARVQWTDEYLTQQRQSADPIGDAAIRTIFERRDIKELDAFMGRLVADDSIPADLPDEIRSFLAETSALPSWASVEQMRAAARMFNIYGGGSVD